MTNNWPAPDASSLPPIEVMLDGRGPVPSYVITPSTKRSRRPRLIGTVAALALLAGGVGTALATRKSGAPSGASTPAAAVQSFLDSIEAGDWLGALESLPAGERQLFVQTIETSLSEAKRLGFVADAASLRKVAGLKIRFEGVKLESENVNDHIARVMVLAGTAVTDVKVSELPIGDLLDRLLRKAHVDRSDLHHVEPTTADDGAFATVKDAEGWHLSLMYSLAEAARGDEPLGAPIGAKGAASPEKAVEEFIRAIMQADATRAIELIDPEEGRVVHDYGSLLVDAASDIDPAGLPQMSELVLTSSKNAFGTAVALKRATLTITTDGEAQRVTIAVDGSCTTVKVDGIDGGSNRICPDDLQKDSVFGTLDGGADLEGLIGVLSGVAFRAQSQLAGAGVITRQVDGQWYVAPGSTLASTIMRFIGAFERADIEKLLKA